MTKVQRVYFHRTGSPLMEDTLDIPLGDDPKRHVLATLIHRVEIVTIEPGSAHRLPFPNDIYQRLEQLEQAVFGDNK